MSLEPQTRARRKLAAAARLAARLLPPALPPALFLTDPARTPVPEEIVAGLPRGWGVVYRHFGAAERASQAARLARLCRARGLILLIAADPVLAARIGADGVHWPFRMRQQMRRWRARFRLQTISAHSAREMRMAAGYRADAVVLSAVFPSLSPSAGPAMGALRFSKLARASRIPVYALGGVTANNAALAARSAGFAAVEGMTAFRQPVRT